jgi:hypothetical protein
MEETKRFFFLSLYLSLSLYRVTISSLLSCCPSVSNEQLGIVEEMKTTQLLSSLAQAPHHQPD